jgi:hypothetical protein
MIAEHEASLRRASSRNPKSSAVVRTLPLFPLVALGVLVSLKVKPPKGRAITYRWPDPLAPIVAHGGDGPASISLVYASTPKGAAPRSSRAIYQSTHWGLSGKGQRLEGLRLAGPATPVGIALAITYATRKGDDRQLVNYVHEFGEGGAGRFVPPTVVVGVCNGRRMMRLDGGSYTVEERGIVG